MTPLYVVLLAFISLRITRQNMIPPSISQRRQVEGLWDLIGRYFTLSHTKNKIDCSSKAFGLCFDLTGVCMYLQKELANNPNCPHMCAYKLVTIKCPWYLKMLPSVVIQVWNHFFLSITHNCGQYIHLFCFECEIPQCARCALQVLSDL